MHGIAFILIWIIALTLPLPVFLLFATAYALLKPGYELIIIGGCIDAQFGPVAVSTPYLYTIILTSIVCILNLLKPHLSMYR